MNQVLPRKGDIIRWRVPGTETMQERTVHLVKDLGDGTFFMSATSPDSPGFACFNHCLVDGHGAIRDGGLQIEWMRSPDAMKKELPADSTGQLTLL